MKLYDSVPSGNCYKVRLLLAHLGRSYERVDVDVYGRVPRPRELVELNPYDKVPVLVLDDGRALPESGAILWWLARGTPWLPEDPWEQTQVLRWMLFEQNSLEPSIAVLRHLKTAGRPIGPGLGERLEPMGTRVLTAMSRHLAERETFVGSRLTIADLALYGYTHAADEAGYELAGYPPVERWLERVRREPGHVPLRG